MEAETMSTATKEERREQSVERLEDVFLRYTTQARAGLGCAGTALELHRMVDEVTSGVYGQEFAYCGRTHRVV